jgi:hypothetical protein
MSDEKTTEFSDLLEEGSIPPDYQRFIAINIQVPIAPGKRAYHRVTITGSHRDLANDLSHILPKKARAVLERSDEPILVKDSHCEFPQKNPYRGPYIAVCSCGAKDCEHIEYAVRHFQVVQAFAENSRRISDLLRESKQRATEAELARRNLERELQSLGQGRQELASQLEAAEKMGKQVTELQEKLRSKDTEIDLLQGRIEQEDEEQARLQREIANYQDNLKAVFTQFWQEKGELTSDRSLHLPDEMLIVFNRRFLLPPSQIPLSNKFQKTVEADHHRVGQSVSHTDSLLVRLASIEFIRELGIGHRHNTKMGKVRIKPKVEQLELLVPYKGEADIIRIITTAQTRAQQFLAAYYLGELFGVEVQGTEDPIGL